MILQTQLKILSRSKAQSSKLSPDIACQLSSLRTLISSEKAKIKNKNLSIPAMQDINSLGVSSPERP